MTRPKLYMLGPGRYTYRMDIRFEDVAGNSVKTKTLSLHREVNDKPQVLLIQANAKLVGTEPKLEEIGRNYVAYTVEVSSLEGELCTTALSFSQLDDVNQQLAAYSLTFSVLMARDCLKLGLYTSRPKPHE